MNELTRTEKAKHLWEGLRLIEAKSWWTRRLYRYLYYKLDDEIFIPFKDREVVRLVDAYEKSGKGLQEFQKQLLRQGEKLPEEVKRAAIKELGEGKGTIDDWIAVRKIYPGRSVLVFKKTGWLACLEGGRYREQKAIIEEKGQFLLWKQANESLRAIFKEESPLGLLPPSAEVSDHQVLNLTPPLKLRKEGYKGRGAAKIVQGFITLFRGVETLQKWSSTHLSIDISHIVVKQENPLILQLMPQDGMFNLPYKLDPNDPIFERMRPRLLEKLERSYQIDPRVTPLQEREALEREWDELIASIKSPPYIDVDNKLHQLKETIKRIQNFQLGVAFFEALTGTSIAECLGRPSPNGIDKAHFKWEHLQRIVYDLSTLSTDSAASIVEWLGKLMARDNRFTITLPEARAHLEKIRGDKA